MRLPLWLRDLAAARQARRSNELWRQHRAERTSALRVVELEERRVLAVTTLAAAADISNVSEGQPLSNITVGTFIDTDPANTQNATINWGDGNTTAGTVQSLGGNQYAVVGSHTYADNAAYQVEVTVQGQSPGEQPFTDQLTITTSNVDPTLQVPANNLVTLNEGSQVTIGNLGLFTDAGTGDVHGVTVDWGDGTVETEYPAQNVLSPNLQITEANGSGKVAGIHVYGDNGVSDGNGNPVHTIKVTVFDDDGGSVTKQLNVIVNNVAPTLTVPGDKTITINEGQQVAFSNLGLFTDPGFLDTHTATVDWGDGTGVQAATVTEANGSGKITGSHIYGDNGIADANGDHVFTVKVTVTDDDGASTSKEFTIVVNNVAPTLTVPGDKLITINEGQQLSLSNLGLFTDPGFLDTHTATVDWGDGTGVQAATVNEANGSGKITGSHIYGDNGVVDANGDRVVTVKVTVTDDDGASTSKQFLIIVNNVAPTLTVPGDKTITINEGQQVAFSNLGLFTDPGFLDTHTATVDWGDGTGVQAATVTEANGSGKITGAHIYGDNGVVDANGDHVFTVKVTVTDDDEASTSQQFTIIVNNVAPTLTVPGDKTITINEGQQLSLSNLGLFTDPGFLDTHTATVDWGDGTGVQAATVNEANGSGKITGSHIYGDNGIVDANGDHVFTVKVTVTDDDGASTSKEFTIIVNNVAPTLTVPGDKTITINEGQQISLSNLGLFTDPGFLDTHTATVDWGDGTGVQAGTVTEANGSGKIAGSHIYGDNGIVDANGDHVFTVKVTVTDDDGASTSKEFTIIVNNVAPTLTVPGDKTITINEGDQLSLSNLGLFTDPGFLDTHAATIDWGDGTATEVGAVTEANGSGKISGSHIYGDNGIIDANGDLVRTIKVTLTDDDGGTTVQEFTIIVTNVAPTLTVTGNQNVTQNDPLSIPQLGKFTDPGFLDTHTATIQWGDGSAAESLNVVQGAGFGSFAGSHTYATPGVYTATVTVIDDDGGMAVQTFNITVLSGFTPILPPNPFGDSPALPPGVTGFTSGGRPDAANNAIYQANDVRDDLSSGNNRLDEAASAEANAANEKRFVLVIVYADGTESEPVTLPDSDVSNLPGLWRRLPDNFYRVYQIQENGTMRLVTQGYVQGGLLVDPNDKNETQDRPPTSQREARPDAPVLAQSLQSTEEASVLNSMPAPVANELLWQPELVTAPVVNDVELSAIPVLMTTDKLPDFAFARVAGVPSVKEDATQEAEHSHVATAAAVAPVVAVGVGIAASQKRDPWAEEVDRALAKLPADWSRTKALWRVRKPR